MRVGVVLVGLAVTVLIGLMRVGVVLVGLAVTVLIGLMRVGVVLVGLAVTVLIGLMRVSVILVGLAVTVLIGLMRVGLVLGGLGVGVVVLGGVLVVGVLVGLVRVVAVVVCGVVFLVGLVRRGLVGLGLVTVARRISSVVGLAVGGVVLRLGVSVRVLAGILVGLVRVGLVLGGLGVGVVVLGGVLVVGVLVGLVRVVAVVVCGVVFLVGLVRRGLVGLGLVTVARRISSVVGLAVGGVVLRLGVSVRVLAGIVPMLSVGIGLSGAMCVARAVASLPGVGGLVRVGGGRVCCMLFAMRLRVTTVLFDHVVVGRLFGCIRGGLGCVVGLVVVVEDLGELLACLRAVGGGLSRLGGFASKVFGHLVVGRLFGCIRGGLGCVVGLVVVVEDLGELLACLRAVGGGLSRLGGFASKVFGHLVVGRLFGCIRGGLGCLGLVAVACRVSSVVGLAVGGVVLRLRVSIRVLTGIVPMLSVGIGLTGGICVA